MSVSQIRGGPNTFSGRAVFDQAGLSSSVPGARIAAMSRVYHARTANSVDDILELLSPNMLHAVGDVRGLAHFIEGVSSPEVIARWGEVNWEYDRDYSRERQKRTRDLSGSMFVDKVRHRSRLGQSYGLPSQCA